MTDRILAKHYEPIAIMSRLTPQVYYRYSHSIVPGGFDVMS